VFSAPGVCQEIHRATGLYGVLHTKGAAAGVEGVWTYHGGHIVWPPGLYVACRDTAHLRMVDFRPGIKMICVGTKRERERERERESERAVLLVYNFLWKGFNTTCRPAQVVLLRISRQDHCA